VFVLSQKQSQRGRRHDPRQQRPAGQGHARRGGREIPGGAEEGAADAAVAAAVAVAALQAEAGQRAGEAEHGGARLHEPVAEVDAGQHLVVGARLDRERDAGAAAGDGGRAVRERLARRAEVVAGGGRIRRSRGGA
jgi:hypothetical protein